MARLLVASVLLAPLLVAGCAQPRVVGGSAGHFVPDAAIQSVKVCETRGEDVLASFGEPAGRGRDNDFTTYQWVGLVTASDGTRAAMRSQMIQVWVDPSGSVAGIVVNPGGMPTTPAACSTRATTAKAAGGKARPNAGKAKTP
jgi:hypothetical protein